MVHKHGKLLAHTNIFYVLLQITPSPPTNWSSPPHPFFIPLTPSIPAAHPTGFPGSGTISLVANTPLQLYSARNDAIGRIVSETQSRGGNAIIALRFDAADLGGWAQVCAYGTAAYIEKIDSNESPTHPQLVHHDKE